jgi:hypothetical protein
MRACAIGSLAIAAVLALALGCDADRPDGTGAVTGRPCRPGEEHEELAAVGAWNWCGDPKAVYHEGTRRTTYVGWVDGEGSVRVGAHDHDTGEFVTSILHEGMERDDHDNPSILVLPDGRLAAFYCPHVRVPSAGEEGLMGMFYRISSSPEDVTAWGPERQLATNTAGSWGYTYPNAVSLSEEGGRIYLFWRGGNGQPAISFSDEGEYWVYAHTLFRSGKRPYAKYASDGASTIHFAFTDGHPRGEPTNNIYYASYRDTTFYRADGTPITGLRGLPLVPEAVDLVYDAKDAGARAWVWDIALDADARPVIAYATFPGDDDHRYRYARWDGAQWVDHEICASGSWFPEPIPDARGRHYYVYYSGGVTLDHDDPSVVYLSRQVDGIHEIERWETPDGGRTWESSAVTCGSSKNNVRPVVPRGRAPGGPEVIWMHGDYTHYTEYDTSLRVLLR